MERTLLAASRLTRGRGRKNTKQGNTQRNKIKDRRAALLPAVRLPFFALLPLSPSRQKGKQKIPQHLC